MLIRAPASRRRPNSSGACQVESRAIGGPSAFLVARYAAPGSASIAGPHSRAIGKSSRSL
jgi:hypothetical protein